MPAVVRSLCFAALLGASSGVVLHKEEPFEEDVAEDDDAKPKPKFPSIHGQSGHPLHPPAHHAPPPPPHKALPESQAKCVGGERDKIHDMLLADFVEIALRKRWPDLTVNGLLPNCSAQNILGGLTPNWEVLGRCVTQRGGLDDPCGSCFSTFLGSVAHTAKEGGCAMQCGSAFYNCRQVFLDASYVGECYGPHLAECLSCMEPHALDFGDCVGTHGNSSFIHVSRVISGGIENGDLHTRVGELVESLLKFKVKRDCKRAGGKHAKCD